MTAVLTLIPMSMSGEALGMVYILKPLKHNTLHPVKGFIKLLYPQRNMSL